MNKIPLIVIVGATASGKTSLSLELAKKFNGEIISVDSVQLYKHFDIGSAKIKKSEMNNIVHHLIDILEPNENFSVYEFQKLARKKVVEVFQRGRIPILIGGTGYYMNAVLYNYNFANYNSNTVEVSIEEMKNYLLNNYKETYDNLDLMNDRRVINAYNYVVSEQKNSINKDSKEILEIYNPYIIVVDKDREELYLDINNRVIKMIDSGLLEEVESIIKKYGIDLQPLGAIGYKEVLAYINQDISYDRMIELIQQNSRRYAKRQLTWFRNKMNVNIWYNKKNNDYEKIINDIDLFLKDSNYGNS